MRRFFVVLIAVLAVLSFSYVVRTDDVKDWAATHSKDTFRFVVFGDSRPVAPTNPLPEDILSRIAFEISIIHPDFVVVTGDIPIGYGDSEEQVKDQLNEFLSIMQKYAPDVPFIYVAGNHEVSSSEKNMEIYRRIFGKKMYYDFYFGGVHFIAIDTNWPKGYAKGKYGFFNVNDGEHDKAMVDWFKEVVKEPAKKKVVFGHVPAFSALTPNFEFKHTKSFDTKENRDEFVKLLVENGVDAYIAGHEHLTYITKKGNTLFITLGGGGAPLYAPVTGGYAVNTHEKPYNKVESDERVDNGGYASGYHYSLHVPAGALGIFDYMLAVFDGKDMKYRIVVPFSFNMQILEDTGYRYHVLVTNRTAYDFYAAGVKAYVKKGKNVKVKAYYVNWGRKEVPVDYEILEKRDLGDMVYLRIGVKVPATYAVHVVVESE